MDRALELKVHDLDFGNIRVTTHHSDRVPPTMLDEHQLVQVMLNILANAEQAIKARQGPGEINIVTRLANGMIRTSISDNGPGIPAEHLHSVFDPFFTTMGVGQGTGLGLSICYGIVHEHSGEMWVESAPGKGATFHIDLPIVPDNVPEEMGLADTDGLAVIGRRILVVDDEAAVRDILHRTLSSDGHNVALASDGASAWKLIQGNQLDLIFLDLRMPGLNGQELYRLITELSQDLAKKVVFITGDTVRADTQSFLDSTANPVLSKPFTIEAVRQLI